MRHELDVKPPLKCADTTPGVPADATREGSDRRRARAQQVVFAGPSAAAARPRARGRSRHRHTKLRAHRSVGETTHEKHGACLDHRSVVIAIDPLTVELQDDEGHRHGPPDRANR